jgi:hypothetical protein
VHIHPGIDLARLGGYCSQKGRVRVAVFIAATAAAADVFATKSVVKILIPTAAKVTIGHDCCTFGEGKLGGAGISTLAARVRASTSINTGGIPSVVGVA